MPAGLCPSTRFEGGASPRVSFAGVALGGSERPGGQMPGGVSWNPCAFTVREEEPSTASDLSSHGVSWGCSFPASPSGGSARTRSVRA